MFRCWPLISLVDQRSKLPSLFSTKLPWTDPEIDLAGICIVAQRAGANFQKKPNHGRGGRGIAPCSLPKGLGARRRKPPTLSDVHHWPSHAVPRTTSQIAFGPLLLWSCLATGR